MKQTITSYTFNASAKTIDLSSIANFDIKRLLAIINSSSQTTIYALGASGMGYVSVSGAVISLQKDTTAMSNTDNLTVLYDIPNGQQLSSVSTSIVVASDQIVPVSFSGSISTSETNSAAIKSDLDAINSKIPAKGSASTASSTPVNIANDQIVPTLESNSGAIKSAVQNIPLQGASTISGSLPVNIASDQRINTDSGPFIGAAAVIGSTFTAVRGINVSVAGQINVDFAGGGTNIPIYVVQGFNAIHITKIYTGGAATVLSTVS